MNWAVFAIGIGLVCTLLVAAVAKRSVGRRAGRWLAAPLLVVIALNGAAPVRALVDPDYIGYSFGLLSAHRGLPVTLLAGGTLIAALVAALIVASRDSGRILLIPAVVSGALAISLGTPLLMAAATDPASFKLQLGEYLTIPGLIAVVLMSIVLVLPFVIGSIWALRNSSHSAGVR